MKRLSVQGISRLLLILFVCLPTIETAIAQDKLQNSLRNIPTYFSGTVSNCYSGAAIGNVLVTADTFSTQTAADGTYSLLVVPDTFDIIFSKPGMYKDTVFGIVARLGVYTEINTSLCEIPYPTAMVYLDPNEADTKALVTWEWNYAGDEIAYDDGDAEEFSMWVQPGGKLAVRFTPPAYPATVSGGRLFVGDGSFPVGADFLGTDMAVGILDDDGPDGTPGSILDSIIVTVNNYNWVDFNGFNATFEEGDFYIVMWQLGSPPQAAPVGIDTDVPTVYRSFSAEAGADWIVSPYQDLMIRATIGIPASSKTTERELSSYDLVWIDGFNPNQGETPEDGTKHNWPGNEESPYLDVQWGPRNEGFYAYAARANYENDTSEWTYSNIAAHKIDNVVTITIEQCDNNIPDNIEVSLVGKNYPYQILQGTPTVLPTDNQSRMVFDSVIDGAYDLTVFKVGYQKYFHFDIQIYNDYEEFVILHENAFPVTNLYVDSLTSVATWDPALITQLPLEEFENVEFPPKDWQATHGGEWGWFRSNHGSVDFIIPPADGYFAVANSNLTFPTYDNYLITPKMDLRQSNNYVLYFDHYFRHGAGEQAFIKYSTDGGISWENYIEFTTPVSEWTSVAIDLSPLSGPTGPEEVWLAFYYTDNHNWAYGWAIDNVSVHDGPAPMRGNYVYLDDSFIVETPPGQTTYTYTDLVYGQHYKASVRAIYTCALSIPIDYYFTSSYLYPPHNLGDTYLEDTNALPLFWLPPKKIKEPESGANKDYPKYGLEDSKIEFGTVSNTLAFNRSSAGDIVKESSGIRDFGDVVDEVSPQGIQPWGVCFDDQFLYLSDPFGNTGTVIRQFNIDGSATGYTIDGSEGGASWVADMASDGEFIYACNVGGDNAIKIYDIETGTLVNTVTGAWATTSQRGLAYDEFNFEFYIGGWNSNNIWRTDDAGGTIDDIPYTGVSGLAWHPLGGPYGSGSLWIAENTSEDLVSETDPNAAWPLLQDFTIPSGAGYSGAGLELNSDGMLWVVNQNNGIVYLVDVEEPLGPPTAYEVPEGLTGFKLYQDNNWIADVPYNGEGVEDTIHYSVNALDPACYSFDVSAIYDLTHFGFPGEKGESMLEGPDTVCVAWGYELPFLEEWDEESFAFNGWRLEGNAWVINSDVGDPEPSAEFDIYMLMENQDYSSTLTSNPLLGNQLTRGDIFFDFNVKLDNLNATGEEKLLVEISTDAGQSWDSIAGFTNLDGSFDFAEGFMHINITNYVDEHIFHLRFKANGLNALDITNWFVDNIHVYHICYPPTDLECRYVWYQPSVLDVWGAEVCWNAPEIPEPLAVWIYWDNQVFVGGIGLTDGGTWSVAQHWDAGQLTNWNGVDLSDAQITKIAFVLYDGGFGSIVLRIWNGPNANTLLFEQLVPNPIIGDWMQVNLNTPVNFDVNEELWIGYTITNQAEGWWFPAGYDEGPAVRGYGDMLTTDGTNWDRISDFGIDHNWAIHAFVEEVPTSTTVTPVVDKTVYNSKSNFHESEPLKIPKLAPDTSKYKLHELSGFNVYRKEIGVDSDFVFYDVVPYIDGQIVNCYFDCAPSVSSGKTYYYKVTANWMNGMYNCESSPALNIPMTADSVGVLVTDIGVTEALTVSLFPNPATNSLNISSDKDIKQITVFNYVGHLVFDQVYSSGKNAILNTSLYQAGIYIIRIDTGDGVIAKRVIITN